MSNKQQLDVAHILIQPRMCQRSMSSRDLEAVDDLVQQFHNRMAGESLVCAAQALGMLTADYVQQITEHGGEGIVALQDVAGRGEKWIHAGDAARVVVGKAARRMVARRKRRVT